MPERQWWRASIARLTPGGDKMGTFASHGSRQSSGKWLLSPASVHLDDWGGQPKRRPDLQVTAEFHPLVTFPPLHVLV